MREGHKRDAARRLRKAMTDAEHRLWHRLRNRRLAGGKFRRQHPVGPYVVDFACVEARLVVELDGGQHAGSLADAVRTRFLAAKGWRVLRFWNDDALLRTEAVLAAIHDVLGAGCQEEKRALIRRFAPPSPAGGRREQSGALANREKGGSGEKGASDKGSNEKGESR